MMARAHDTNPNEKVSIYHHGLHDQFRKRSSILQLKTESGIKTGHNECAKALEDNVAAHLLNPADLSHEAQELLLNKVEESFTDDDNDKLRSPPTKAEVKKVLNSSKPHSAPWTDSLTAFFYQQCWHVMGDPLTEIIQAIFNGAKPTASQRTSLMVFGNKPGKKAKSLKISDRRKLSLLNLDFKLLTGIEAPRIRATMHRTISPLQLVSGGDKRISHGIAMARDAIMATTNSSHRCGILDTDLIAAFCNMVALWCFMVLRKKGLDDQVIERYKNLYADNISIVVVNGMKGRAVKNIMMSIRQGDKFAMELFSYGMDPILHYLERRLQGILVHSLPVQGPVLHQTLPAPAPPDPPKIPGLPDLPPAPPATGRPHRAIQKWTLPPIETRYILFAYCDNLKPAVTSRWEFLLVERVMTIFEMASGCKMHRTAESQKCKFLFLGKWKTELTQDIIPHGFFSKSDHLDFLGVTL